MATPVALGAGIYLAEYAKKNVWTEWIRALIEMLASLPSIVIGIFIFLTFVVHMGWGFSILSGAVALAIFNMPLLVQVVEESVRSVPKQQKQAGLALGVSRWETIAHIVLPAALPEIVTGMILGAGRVFGEAGALIYTAGMSSPNLDFANWNPFSPSSPLNPMRPAETLAVHIWKVNGESIVPDAEAISSGATLLLILSIFICNISARIIELSFTEDSLLQANREARIRMSVFQMEKTVDITTLPQVETIAIEAKSISVYYRKSMEFTKYPFVFQPTMSPRSSVHPAAEKRLCCAV